jgi:hypothetical protein
MCGHNVHGPPAGHDRQIATLDQGLVDGFGVIAHTSTVWATGSPKGKWRTTWTDPRLVTVVVRVVADRFLDGATATSRPCLAAKSTDVQAMRSITT